MMSIGVHILALLSLSLLVEAFSRVPVSQEAAIGSEAVFRCKHPAAFSLGWQVNGTFYIPGSIPGVTPGLDGNLISTLTIVATVDYNGTRVACVASLTNGSTEISAPVLLLVHADGGTQTSTSMPPTTTSTTTAAAVPTTTTAAPQNFIQHPSSVNVTDGKKVDFHCMHQSLDVIWKLNESRLGLMNFPPGVSESRTFIGSDAGIRYSLTIVAALQYNNTSFTCALLSDYSIQSEEALLRVQGPLDAPKDLNSSRDYESNTITITWTPPPSLDLTGVDPDIVYCIEVVNITCGEGGEVLVSECGITQPIYQSRDIPLNYICNITVTPRSNVEGAMNGTAATLEEEFPILSQQTSVSKGGDSNVDVKVIMDITEHHNKPLPSVYSLLLTPANTSNSKLKPTVEMKRSDSIVLAVVNGLEEQMLLDCIVVAYTCHRYPLTNRSVLSTHLAQNISVSSRIAGEISVTGYFLDSTSTSILVIVYSSTTVRYQLHSGTVNGRDFRAIVDNLEGGSYYVSVFTVENGTPLRQAATKPQSVYVSSVESSSGVVQPTFQITYTLQSTSSGVCVNCTFLESSTTGCVAVVHQRISQLNSSGLMNIESSHKFTRSGDTASGCIEGVNLEDRHVGVVGGRHVMPAPEPLCVGCTFVSAVAVICVLLVSVLILIAIVYRKLHRKGSRFRSRSNTVANEQGLPDQPKMNDYEIAFSPEIRVESTHLLPRVRADSSGSGISQPQEESPGTAFQQTSFTGPPVPPYRTSEDEDDNCQTEAVPESAFAEPARLVKPPVSIPPFTERSTYSNVEKFRNREGLEYAMVVFSSQKQHNPRVDDRWMGKSEYSVIQLKKEENCTSSESENRMDKSPQSSAPPTPCDVENLRSLLHDICSKWKKLAKALSLDEDHIEDIYTGNEMDEECLQEVLERYFDNGDFNHNWEEIVAILRKINENQLADKIYYLHVYSDEALLPGQTQHATECAIPTIESPRLQIEQKNEIFDSSVSLNKDSTSSGSESADEQIIIAECEEEVTATPVQESTVKTAAPVHPTCQDDMPLERQTHADQAGELSTAKTAGALLSEKDTGYDSDLTSTGPEPKSCTSPAVAVEQQSDLQDGINNEMNPDESQSDVMEPPSEVVIPKGKKVRQSTKSLLTRQSSESNSDSGVVTDEQFSYSYSSPGVFPHYSEEITDQLHSSSRAEGDNPYFVTGHIPSKMGDECSNSIPVTCRHTSREDVTDGMSTLIQVFNNDFDHTVVHAPLICTDEPELECMVSALNLDSFKHEYNISRHLHQAQTCRSLAQHKMCENVGQAYVEVMKETLTLVLLFLVVSCVIHCSITDFVLRPSNSTVAQGQVAHFLCQHSSALAIGWNVNDTIITDQDVGEDIQRSKLGSVHQLDIKARLYFNSTRVKCVAHYGVGSNDTISSPWAFVIIQGLLDPVTNLMRDPPTRIAWTPPFSLNLTGLMTAILYCIRVVNITGGTDEFLYGHCNVTTPYFDDDSLSCQGCLYEITVTPYSNGGGSLNGTPSTWRESNDIIPPTSTHQLNNSTMDLRNNTVAQEGTKLAEIVLPVVLILTLILVAVSVAGLIAYMKICKRRNLVKKVDETENIMIYSPKSPSGVGETDRLLQSAQKNSSQVVSSSGVRLEPLPTRRLSYGSASDAEERSEQTSECKEGEQVQQTLEGSGERKEEEQIHQGQEVLDSAGVPKEELQIRETQEELDSTSEDLQIQQTHEGSDSTSGGEEQAQDDIQFPTSDTEDRDESRDPLSQGSLAEGEGSCVSQREETEETRVDQSTEIVDESQCNMRGPITVSSDASEISYYVAVAHTHDGVLIRNGHSDKLTFAIHKPNSDENSNAMTESVNVETPVFSVSGNDYIAQGVNDLQGGMQVNVDDQGSRPEQFNSEPSTPRNTRPLEPPRTQAQRVDASGNDHNLMPAHVIPQIREADDVSGTRITSFSSDVDGEDKLVTDAVTPKNGRVRYQRKRISALSPECVHIILLNYTDDISKCSKNKRIKINALVEQDVIAKFTHIFTVIFQALLKTGTTVVPLEN